MCPATAVYEGRWGRVGEHGEDSQEGRPVFVSVTIHLFVTQVAWTPVNRTESESLGQRGGELPELRCPLTSVT